MQSKFENFNDSPEELKIETAQNLSNSDLVNFAQTSKFHLALFKPVIDVRKLLHYVTRGEHDVVKAMLKQDISLIFKRGFVTDCSGREFESISGFEYALWAMDKHMWAAMIKCIPQNAEGRKVFALLLAQYNTVNTDGVTYRLNGTTITEKHFDFENTIIKELQTQVDSINAPGEKTWDAIDNQWRKGVGGAQKKLPMHVVYQYCSFAPFYPVPKFTSKPMSSKKFYNGTTEKVENWFNADSKLSVDFAIFRGWMRGEGCARPSWRGGVQHDLDAMTALCKVRTNDFIELKSLLEEQMTVDNQPQVYQM
ncbi:F-box protein [Legionella sp. km535]|uniref:F-box protein n=1 Tax=Legionella sp. km535 TaxID=2498107 RepID=UPI000F8D3383|nr:F-box protein [Legionella sp. km535]RUR17193.1 F-box protein [Legionella sp. km535]